MWFIFELFLSALMLCAAIIAIFWTSGFVVENIAFIVDKIFDLTTAFKYRKDIVDKVPFHSLED